MSTPAVFIDRDGVINVDHGYVCNQDDFEYIDGVFESCKALKEMGYLLVLVTNQSGIARGYYTEDDFLGLTEWMDWNFADKGVDFDGIYYCPHHIDGSVEAYTIDCDCRKPKVGMFQSAKQFLDIDMKNSIMIGDKAADMQASLTAGVETRILVRSGHTIDDESIALSSVVLDSIADVPSYIRQEKIR